MKALLDTSVLISADPPGEVEAAISVASAAVYQRGGNPRRRQIDLAIAATASVERVPLLTHNLADFEIINDLVDARQP